MEENFLNKINSAYKKGMSVNPQFEKAARAINLIAKGENNIEVVKDLEKDALEI